MPNRAEPIESALRDCNHYQLDRSMRGRVMGGTDLLICEDLMQTAQDVVRTGLLALSGDNRRVFLSYISDFLP